jgi:hypothetical protein
MTRPRFFSLPLHSVAGAALVAALLAGCASLPTMIASLPRDTASGTPATPPAARAASVPGAPPPAAAPLPAGAPPAFATVIKDAKPVAGVLTLWQRDEKLWIELRPDDFGRPMFLSPKVAGGIGEAPVYGGAMSGRGGPGGAQLVEFRRIHNMVQLVARNIEYFAKAGTPEARAVQAAFSPSLIGSAPVASQPHPESKAVLIEAHGMFASDMLGIGAMLQRAYRQGYAFDARNSAVVAVRGSADATVVEVQNHYATSSLAAPQPGSSGAPGTPRALPDPRSLFVRLHYSLSRLPAEPMAPRKADSRVGYFDTLGHDFGDDIARTPKLRWINRWRLEKKEPAATMSEPVRPITYWLDRTIPQKYRAAITEGVLEWNKAFERIGYRNAIVVQVQPEDAVFDTLDVDRASIRWMTNAAPRFGAVGPSHVDPRSGEILDADIAVESLSSRSMRTLRSQILGPDARPTLANLPDAATAPGAHAHGADCGHADHAAEQLGYAVDVLALRSEHGEHGDDSAHAEQFVLDYLKDVTMHEVGHTLGLRHNFRASRAYTEAQLSDPVFTREHGISASVMDYQPVNLPRPGQPGGARFQLALGPYDYWAIEYGYAALPAGRETQVLAAIAGRSSADPLLAYGTDEDNYLGIDPESLQFDLGGDVLEFAKKRFAIAHDLLQRQESRRLNGDYAVLRRSINFAVRDLGRAASVAARQIGGVRTLRDAPGSGRDPLQPVAAEAQRATLDLLARNVFAPEGLVVSPSLQRRLAPDYLERGDALADGDGPVSTDYSVTQTIFDVQRSVLAHLMSDAVATRILDSETKFDRPAEAFRLSELVHRLTREIWSELDRSGDIAQPRRELQREHVNRVAGLLLRPGAMSRADARSLWRMQARDLLGRMQAALRRNGLGAEAAAHLRDSAQTLELALAAPLQRAGS